MSRNGLYALVAVLAIAIIGFAIYTYQEQQKAPGLEVRINETGVSIDGNG